MAGGTWTTQNKIIPAVYINYKSAEGSFMSIGERGVVAIARVANWGEVGKIIEISSPNDCWDKLGYDQNASEMEFVRQIFLGSNRTGGARKILFWRLSTTSSVAASGTHGNLTATAKYVGTRGNDIKIVATASADNSDENGYYMTVQTVLDGSVVDSQTVYKADSAPTVDQLKSNNWVVFSGNGSITATVGVSLTGGANGTLSATAHSNFMTALERVSFDVVAYDGTDSVQKAAYASLAKRLYENEGVNVSAVISDYNAADSINVISTYPQQVTFLDGTTLDAQSLVWWVAGATAGANTNESLTNATYPSVSKINPELSKGEQEEAINSGKFALVNSYNEVRVLYDINTFRSYTANKGKLFSKNRNVRTVFSVSNSIHEVFSKYYIGSVNNDEDGRNLLKAEIVSLLYQLESNHSLQNVSADDVVLTSGNDKDSVVATVAIQLVDSAEKIYITITCS